MRTQNSLLNLLICVLIFLFTHAHTYSNTQQYTFVWNNPDMSHIFCSDSEVALGIPAG